MEKIFITAILVLITNTTHAQIAKDLMINAHGDLIKSDNSGYFEKIQTSIEVNYFVSRKFTATGGFEFWTDGPEASVIIGGRWCPIPEAFVRLRGLIGTNDISIGGGWAKPLKNNWRFEAIGDIYAEGHIAIRAGFAYIIRIKK
jgi:hypothetical protein